MVISKLHGMNAVLWESEIFQIIRTTDRICEKRRQSVPALIPVSLSPYSWQGPEWTKATGAAPLVLDPHSQGTSDVSLT